MERKQKTIWENEHAQVAALPSHASGVPYSGVEWFAQWLLQNGVKPEGARVVDVGCGKGRNSVFLAEKGFEVYGMDYVKGALEAARQLAQSKGVEGKLKLVEAEIDSQWPFPQGFFDVALDCFSSIDIETAKGREKCRDELHRTLKPGGHAFVAVVSAQDEFESEMMKTNPGPEKNSVIWPQNGKFQKDYDEQELREFYSGFKMIEFREVQKPAFKLGRKFTSTNFWLVLRK